MKALISKLKSDFKSQKGIIIIYEIVIIFVFSLVMVGLIGYAIYQLKLINSITRSEQAFQIAEAGVNYYQWHLAHYPTDYQDGTGTTGPYLHDYVDKDTNQVIGRFSLNITPPSIGSTIVTIQSTGYTLTDPTLDRTVTVRYGIPSLAQYGFLSSSYVHVGSASTFYGRFHSNSGIQFDGTATGPVTSARATYTCSGSDDCNGTHNGIWGTANAATQALWQFPVSNIDFSSMTSDLNNIRTQAQTGGIYLPPGTAGTLGYNLVFNAAGNISIYRVTSLRAHASGTDVSGNTHSEDLDYQNRTQIDGVPGPGINPFPMPANGLIFIEDEVWVEGTVNGRALVAAARLPYNPATAPSIFIPNNLRYLSQDGTHVLGLIGQRDVLITYFAPNNLDIHAAFIAQNGSFQRYCFANNLKNTLNVYGSISSAGRVGIYCTGNGGSGYQVRNYTYDGFLLYGPPPGFPLSSEGYRQISWESN